jgi:hypothetical protein
MNRPVESRREWRAFATIEILGRDTVIRIRKNGLSKKVIDSRGNLGSAAPGGRSDRECGEARPQASVRPRWRHALANAQGRIGHLGVHSKCCLFVSALDNRSEEAIDLGSGRVTLSVAVPAHADPGGEVLLAVLQAWNTSSYRHS